MIFKGPTTKTKEGRRGKEDNKSKGLILDTQGLTQL